MSESVNKCHNMSIRDLVSAKECKCQKVSVDLRRCESTKFSNFDLAWGSNSAPESCRQVCGPSSGQVSSFVRDYMIKSRQGQVATDLHKDSMATWFLSADLARACVSTYHFFLHLDFDEIDNTCGF